MVPPRLSSIGKKLFWAIGVPGLLAAVVGVWLFWKQADTAVTDSSRDEAQALAELIASSFSIAQRERATPTPPDARAAHRSVTDMFGSKLRLFKNVRSARVTDDAGVVRWSRNVEEEGKTLATLPSPESGAKGVQVTLPLGGMECAGCHKGASMKVGTLSLTVEQPKLQHQITTVFGGAMTSVLALFTLLLVFMAVSLRVYLVRPLQRLTRIMGKAEEGDFLVRAEVHSKDEIGALADAFNRMLARITSLKAQEIDTHRDLERAQEELSLKAALEETNTELSQRVAEQALLFEVSRSLTSTLELPELFARISNLVGERLKVPKFSIMLLSGETLEVKAEYPPNAGAQGMTFGVGQGACGRAARTQTAVYIPDLEQDAEVYLRREGEAHPQGSLLTVPMIHKGQVLGVLNLERPARSAFAQNEIELLAAVADLAAIATKNALLHEETVELSITDPLTGASNRRHMFARLEMEVARALRYDSPLSVLMVDIDSFKHLNDTQGHRMGDQALKKVCDVLRIATRKVDTLARYGGEEFMLILPQVPKSEALEVGEKLRRAVEETAFEGGGTQPLGKVTISIGASSLHVDSSTLEGLVDCADSALYASKRGGRNRTTGYQPGMELHPGRERGPHAKRPGAPAAKESA